MPSGSSKSSKPKPSEVAAETKKHYTPLIRKQYSGRWNLYSYYFEQPLRQCTLGQQQASVSPPAFGKLHVKDWILAWVVAV